MFAVTGKSFCNILFEFSCKWLHVQVLYDPDIFNHKENFYMKDYVLCITQFSFFFIQSQHSVYFVSCSRVPCCQFDSSFGGCKFLFAQGLIAENVGNLPPENLP